jgi:pre-mRNA-splicing helicase BRR2
MMGDQPLEIIKGALDEIIATLKSDLKDTEKKGEIEALVDRVTEQNFNSLTVLGQCLVDY